MMKSNKNIAAILWLVVFIHISLLISCLAIDTISKTQQVLDDQTLVSEGEVFELGFFSPNSSHVRYVGIWYRGLPVEKVVWVANSDNPLTDTSGVLVIGRDGNLVLMDGNFKTVWSTKLTSAASNDTIAVLGDSGNLVLIENKSNGSVLWESFSHPTDSFLSGMKLGLNTKTEESLFLRSWKSENDPSAGSFVLGLEPSELPEGVILNGTIKYWRSGQWDRKKFIGIPDMDTDYLTGFNLIKDNQAGTIYLVYAFVNKSSPLFLSSQGSVHEMKWDAETRKWVNKVIFPKGPCDIYGTCGSFGICNDININFPICNCLRGYKPKSPEEWQRGNWTGGCIRSVEIQCERNSSIEDGKSDAFIQLTRIKLPDFSNYMEVRDATHCGDLCLKNCSCVAYAHVNGIGCMVWGGHLNSDANVCTIYM